MEKIYSIYKVTNKVDGKIYIGFDSKWPSRKSAHLCEAFTRNNNKYPLYNALRKYGKDNFEWEVICQTKDRKYGISVLENYFIKLYNCNSHTGNGYNLTNGGEATFGWIPSEETKRKISESKKGKIPWNKNKKMSKESIINNIKGQKVSSELKKKEYKITKPDSSYFIIKGLKIFCKENTLNFCCMINVSRGRLKQYKGWKCERI